MSVEERVRALKKRPVPQSLKDMQDRFEEKRRNGGLKPVDISQSFVDAFHGQKQLSKEALSQEERDEAKFLMGHLRRCARQNLSKAQFRRIEKELK